MNLKNYSDNELCQEALVILTQHLGPANTLRFLSLSHSDQVDYMVLREQLFEGQSAREVCDNAAAFRQRKRSVIN
jgi:hypothetical protein